MAKKITDTADQWMTPDQYQGSVGDGVYGHCHVPELLAKYYNRIGFDVWDGMHVGATVGRAMRKLKLFSWLDILDDTMASGSLYINFGSGWHQINEVFLRRKADGSYDQKTLKTPKFSSDTRFENFIYIQYKDFRERYPLLLEVLESTKEDFRKGDSTEQKRAETADQIQGRMFNTKFALSLSGMCDVYRCYSSGIKILQVGHTFFVVISNLKFEYLIRN